MKHTCYTVNRRIKPYANLRNAAMAIGLQGKRRLTSQNCYFCGRTFSPLDFRGSMTVLRLNIVRAMYPRTAIAIRLLMVMLAIIAAQVGKTPKISGGGKNSHKYPPTMNPMGRAPTAQASSRCFLRSKMRQAAIRLATGPRITSGVPTKKYAFVKKQPSVTPPIIGQPNRTVNAIMKSAMRSWMGP